MRKIRRALEIISLLFMLLLCAMILLAGSGRMPYLFGYRILKVVSGSMQPAIPDETCIIIRRAQQEELQVGSVITFISHDPVLEGYLNTHRIVRVEEDAESSERLYHTKGDAASEEDVLPVSFADVQGIYVRELPFGRVLFQAAMFLADRTHYFVIVILPLLFCCLSYIRELFCAIFGKETK